MQEEAGHASYLGNVCSSPDTGQTKELHLPQKALKKLFLTSFVQMLIPKQLWMRAAGCLAFDLLTKATFHVQSGWGEEEKNQVSEVHEGKKI